MADAFDVDADTYDGVDIAAITQDALDAVAVDTQTNWQELMDQAGYRNTGEAIRSIAIDEPFEFVRRVGSDRIQVLIGELGRAPGAGMPPRRPIADWVHEQAGLPDRGDPDFDDAVWGVRKGIDENGLEAYHFGERAARDARDLDAEIDRRLEAAVEEESVE